MTTPTLARPVINEPLPVLDIPDFLDASLQLSTPQEVFLLFKETRITLETTVQAKGRSITPILDEIEVAIMQALTELENILRGKSHE
ncbi:hypothetical protein BST81_00785 [Leptolyngbya sp. 'hensonii']|uniref:hypothetical protein n=1 Tax=Leptolyngbya sp. 'hensonii' TaxID=1922337 RepID=UPI00095018A6|nr:hypothetical protein [Leptolyngbya sp. 'hensonii']OLP20307.1 hypothetical protein BST81_00785 [Leptolyngbya sp. 'hensonii']